MLVEAAFRENAHNFEVMKVDGETGDIESVVGYKIEGQTLHFMTATELAAEED